MLNYANKKLIHSPKDEILFTGLGFFIAGTFGLSALTYQITVKKEKFVLKSIWGGILLGLLNFFLIYFLLKALSSGILESSQVFLTANVFIVVFSSISGVLIFKEKLSHINVIGILLSVLAIGLIIIKLA